MQLVIATPAAPTLPGLGPPSPTAFRAEGCTHITLWWISSSSPPTHPRRARDPARIGQPKSVALLGQLPGERRRPVRFCPPHPGPPRASEPPRPWPSTRPSSPAQMPRRSRRVGTCPRLRAGAGARATGLPRFFCLPRSPLFCVAFTQSSLGGPPRLPPTFPPLSQQEARALWFPWRPAEEVGRQWGAVPPRLS